MKGRNIIILALIFVFVYCSRVSALEGSPDLVVVNSGDWVDVYSGVLYANLLGKPFNFVTSREHSVKLLSVMGSKNIYLIESERVPFVVGYGGTLKGKGFSVEERSSGSGKALNLELAEELSVDGFILVDDTYGYDAVSVCPYAVASNSYVLFVDAGNVDEVCGFLRGRGAEVLVYGHMGEGVLERLEEFDPEVIDYGDKFDNNIEIVKRCRLINPVDQVVLTSGDFIELGLMRGVEPVLFVGRDFVPDQVVDYVTGSGIKVGVLIGNDLVRSAQSLKARTGISLFLKFGQGSGAGFGSASVSALDLFYLPSYVLNVSVEGVAFNAVTDELEVVYVNSVDSFSFFKSAVKVYAGDVLVQTVGDREPVLINAGGVVGLGYPVDLSGVDLKDSMLRADVFLQFGESRRSLEESWEGVFDVDVVEVRDLSDIEVTDLVYDLESGVLSLGVRNRGPSCFVRPAFSLSGGGVDEVVGGVDTYPLGEGAVRDVVVEVGLSEEDLGVSSEVGVSVLYGARENFLVNELKEDMRLKVVGGGGGLSTLFYPAVVVLLLAVIVVLLLLVYRKRS